MGTMGVKADRRLAKDASEFCSALCCAGSPLDTRAASMTCCRSGIWGVGLSGLAPSMLLLSLCEGSSESLACPVYP